ncbi:ribonuclease 3 [Lampetra fluviatilis]
MSFPPWGRAPYPGPPPPPFPQGPPSFLGPPRGPPQVGPPPVRVTGPPQNYLPAGRVMPPPQGYHPPPPPPHTGRVFGPPQSYPPPAGRAMGPPHSSYALPPPIARGGAPPPPAPPFPPPPMAPPQGGGFPFAPGPPPFGTPPPSHGGGRPGLPPPTGGPRNENWIRASAPRNENWTSASGPRNENWTSTSGPRNENWSSASGPRNENWTGTSGPRNENWNPASGPRNENWTGTSGPRKENWTGASGPRNENWTGTSGPRKENWTGTSGPRNENWAGASGPRNENWTGTSGPRNENWTSASTPQNENWTGTSGPRKENWTGTSGPRNENWTGASGPRNENWSSASGARNENWNSTVGPQNENWKKPVGPRNENWNPPVGPRNVDGSSAGARREGRGSLVPRNVDVAPEGGWREGRGSVGGRRGPSPPSPPPSRPPLSRKRSRSESRERRHRSSRRSGDRESSRRRRSGSRGRESRRHDDPSPRRPSPRPHAVRGRGEGADPPSPTPAPTGTLPPRHEDFNPERPVWVRCSTSESYFSLDPLDQVGESTAVGTSLLTSLCEEFEQRLGRRRRDARASRPHWEPPPSQGHSCGVSNSSSSSDSDSESESECGSEGEGGGAAGAGLGAVDVVEEIRRRKSHPDRLHPELWFNDLGQMNDGPLCKCSARARSTGIRHAIYPGEEPIEACRPTGNNAGRLFHYRVTVSPATNFLTDRPTVIDFDDHEYIFEGFSLLSHSPLKDVTLCKVVRFNIDYSIIFLEETLPQNFTVRGLELLSSFIFSDLLELHDWDLSGPQFPDGRSSCPRFHFFPRFVRSLPDNGKEVLSLHQVLLFLLRSATPLVSDPQEAELRSWTDARWQRFAEECKGMIVTNPVTKPTSVRIDQLDRDPSQGPQGSPDDSSPIIVHFGIRPAQLSYAGDPQYQKLWRSYLKLRHLLANSPKGKASYKQRLMQREEALQRIRQKNSMRREVTVELSSRGFYRTGLRSDVCQHAMMLPVLTHHIRYHQCLQHLETLLGYRFNNRELLQLAMTHPSHHLNFGMNPDHARNALSNCGVRQPTYGDRRAQHLHQRKKGINTLINIMSRLGHQEPTPSRISHNERLEFLGDAVVEFLSSVHLYFLFPSLEEGGLATYRTAIVQNQHLAILAKKLQLDAFMLYAHGPDLCRESDLRHAMANCFEALIGALYDEGGMDVARQLFGRLLFDEENLREVWLNYPQHPLQSQEPGTDRHLVAASPVLRSLTELEVSIGVDFSHIRLLARAFTLRTVGFNHLTLGHNQRMEFLGDSIMQMVTTEYLYRHFPEHHEGHLTLLRSSLVNNRTQAKVALDLGLPNFAINNDKTQRSFMRTKVLADLLESFLSALYIDKDLQYVRCFMDVCFFPRLKEFILNQDWNDPKSQLQQCCLTLRTEGREPDIPVYKILQTLGPSHARTYTVAVYFKGERLGCGTGQSIQRAEMKAAQDALEKHNFPQMIYQKRFMERKYGRDARHGDLETRRRGEAEARRRGDNKPRRRGDTETRGHGDAEKRRDAETRGHGDTETRGHGDAETRGHGDAEKRRDAETRGHRDAEKRRLGDTESQRHSRRDTAT